MSYASEKLNKKVRIGCAKVKRKKCIKIVALVGLAFAFRQRNATVNAFT